MLHKALSLRIFKVGRICCPLWTAQELRVEGTCKALLGLRLVPKSQAPEHPPSLLLPQSLPGILGLHRDVCGCDSGVGVGVSKSIENKNLAAIQPYPGQ